MGRGWCRRLRVDDDLAFLQPWGFDLADISVPVLIRYGMTDVLVPPAHGEWLAANVPGCIVKVNDAAGQCQGSDSERQRRRERPLADAGIGALPGRVNQLGRSPDGQRPSASKSSNQRPAILLNTSGFFAVVPPTIRPLATIR